MRDQLLAAIESGQYRPGDLLPSERVLGETFGVSRVSVREAIARLEAIGLIAVRHGKGAFVVATLHDQITGPFQRYLAEHRDELLDLLKVRGALDELAAEEAATRATPKAVQAVRVSQEAFRRCAEQEPVDFARLASLDVEFHLAIARASGSGLLRTLLEDLHGAMEDSRRMTLARNNHQPGRSVDQHAAIVEAIAAGQEAKARREAAKHLSGLRDWIGSLSAPSSASG